MWTKLEEAFEEMGFPYSRQGSYEEDEELPSSFFTFWNADTPEDGFFDNEANRAVWVWYIYFYTKDPSYLYSKLEEFIRIAKSKGFIVEGKGKDLASGEPDYFGRYVSIRYIENYNLGGNENA